MSEVVKEALGKAVQAYCCGDAACHNRDCGVACAALRSDKQRAGMTRAIATFLRALPGEILFAKPCDDDEGIHARFIDGAEDFDDLAAAVSRAGGGE